MERLYSVTLFIALLAGSLAVLRGIFRLLKGSPRLVGVLSARAVAFVLILGTLALMISVSVHHLWGHGPASAQPLEFGPLIAQHEAFIVAAALLALGLALTGYAGRKGRDGKPSD
jgi:hypothetical protein